MQVIILILEVWIQSAINSPSQFALFALYIVLYVKNVTVQFFVAKRADYVAYEVGCKLDQGNDVRGRVTLTQAAISPNQKSPHHTHTPLKLLINQLGGREAENGTDTHIVYSLLSLLLGLMAASEIGGAV